MLKLVLSILFLGMGLNGFAQEASYRFFTEVEGLTAERKEALLFLGSGNNRLLSYDFQGALEDFEFASDLIENEPELEFLIAFGRVIAYDNLQLKDQTQNALISLFTIMMEDDDEGDEVEYDFYTEEFQETGEEILNTIANLARTPNIRELLVKMFSKI